jgi:hypothetical protein
MADNAQGFAAINDMIAAVRALPEAMRKDGVIAVRDEGLRILRQALTAGVSPATGDAWAPRVKDGGRAYANAASRLGAAVVGGTVVFSLAAPEVFGHFGAQGRVRREMLPRGVLPFKLGDAIRKGLVPPFRKAMRGGKR